MAEIRLYTTFSELVFNYIEKNYSDSSLYFDDIPSRILARKFIGKDNILYIILGIAWNRNKKEMDYQICANENYTRNYRHSYEYTLHSKLKEFIKEWMGE